MRSIDAPQLDSRCVPPFTPVRRKLNTSRNLTLLAMFMSADSSPQDAQRARDIVFTKLPAMTA